MKRLLLIPALLVAVAACTPGELDDGFAIACQSVPLADAGFQLYASTGKVKASVIAIEKQAVAAAQGVCTGPRPADTKTAVAAVQRAVTAIINATAQARAQAGS